MNSYCLFCSLVSQSRLPSIPSHYDQQKSNQDTEKNNQTVEEEILYTKKISIDHKNPII